MEENCNIQGSIIKKHLCNVTTESLLLGIFLAIAGGFLDAHTFVGRGGAFGNTQTGNLVLLGVDFINGDFNKILLHTLPIIAFMIGVFCAEMIKYSNSIKTEHTILIFEIIIFLVIGFLPKGFSNDIINITISFATSLQYCAFKKLNNSPYATTMCTGNLRTASMAIYKAFASKDHEALKKSLRYFIVIFSFLFGAFLGAYLTKSFGGRAIWAADIFLLISLVLLFISEISD